ncbi:NAD-glutamate dehydrogenase domain-containing protein [Roseomonas sp. CAU 1739]|uniref:NAD-glutamate dehydrogenase n=1 Tax=Roseomonas sp. CAU 1739 TaxID=3140364 RepID=UPI00325B5C3B
MADDARALPDTTREEVLRAAAEALAAQAPALPADATDLLRALHAAVPTAELAATPPEALATAAASLYGFAADRAPGTAKVRILPAGPGSGPRPVAEIVTDDMPFLVDTVLSALALHGRAVASLLHPVLRVRRDPAGRLLALDPAASTRESMMRVTLGAAGPVLSGAAARPAEALDRLEQALAGALIDVRAATAAFPTMLDLLHTAESEVAAPGSADAEEAAAFLHWLAEDNFVLLGHRRFALAADGAIAIVPEENLGLLRDPAVPVFDALRDLSAIPPAVRATLAHPTPVAVAKANMRSTVHRPQHADVVATRIFDADGNVIGGRLFLGLFAAAAYNRNPRSIPLLRRKVDHILAIAGVEADSHDGRALRNILDTWPRDELFQAPAEVILDGARRALDLTIRPRAALVVRHDPFERFVSAIAWLPRDTFDTRLRERAGQMIARAFGGRLSAFYIALGDAPLARIHYIIATKPGEVPSVDTAALESAIAQAARGFGERLAEALTATEGEAEAAARLARWRDSFPAAYRETVTAAQGVADIHLSERAIAAGRPRADLQRAPGAGPRALTLRLANAGGPLALADALPLFESLDLRAVEEQPYHLTPAEGPPTVLHVYRLEAGADCPEDRFDEILGALSALLDGAAEADGFNRLVLRAGLDWRECWLLRAMFRWAKQVGFPFAQASVEAALSAQPEAARLLVEIFRRRFDPDATDRDTSKAEAAWTMLLDGIENPDEDRILTRLRVLLDAMLRTTFFQNKDTIAFKLDSALAGEMPLPRPWREIFVHGMRMEGCHLRAGPVARGGIRWSDRREDFRTEILGLMKAQRLKNVIIVPTGAKGGFVLKHPPPASDREAFQAEGIACYKLLVRGMLDLADNYQGTAVVTPPGIIRRDGEDPYIVAAADKGTATFSDIANGLSAEYGFWLGDAFASGGSAGYDHKGMGITARGAWVMIDRHFQETLGRSVQDAPFDMVGVGDMSGDVFGNGLLVSRQTRLRAAFDHRHIFLDPDPDAEASFVERERLFALPRSSWADYTASLISAGGGVFARNAKTIPLSAQAQAMLGIAAERAEPVVIMQAILRMEVDLLYFGGIGTYLKASTESQADAGDRANDSIRINGSEVRAKVVGEGANLGVTQAGRIEAARQGIRINTDALDNSAGVSTSDHEVNIKILLADAEGEGVLTRRNRDELLRAMTDEVAGLVLRDNHQQSLAVTLEQMGGADELSAQAALMDTLEHAGLLDRAVAGLPDAAAMARRIGAGDALTRPEIAALLPFAKLWLTDALGDSDLPDEPALLPALVAYFPHPLRDAYARYIERHRLRRDLVATIVANAVANRLGCAALARLTMAADPVAACRAALLAAEAFGLEAACDAIDAAPAAADTRLTALLSLRRLQEAAAHDLLGAPVQSLEQALATLRPGIAALAAAAAASLPAPPASLPAEAAALAAAAPRLAAAPAVVRLAGHAGVDAATAAGAWAAIEDAYALDALRIGIAAAPAPGAYGPRARAVLAEELAASQMRLAAQRLAGGAPPASRAASVAALVQEAATARDLAAVTVAVRGLATLGG